MKTIPQAGATEREMTDAIRALIDGRNNATGTVTLSPGHATTIIEKSTINANGAVLLFPQTATAQAARVYGTIQPNGGSVVLTHDVSAAADRTFYYAVIGG